MNPDLLGMTKPKAEVGSLAGAGPKQRGVMDSTTSCALAKCVGERVHSQTIIKKKLTTLIKFQYFFSGYKPVKHNVSMTPKGKPSTNDP